MKRMILAAVALLMLTSISSAQMGRRNRGYQQPRGGIFSRLIEMERAKNAWIRENIFRR